MPAATARSTLFKDWFDGARYRSIARALRMIEPRFDAKQFLSRTLTGLHGRSLMERLRLTADAAHDALPGDFAAKLAVLRKLAPTLKHGFVSVFLAEFVARHGLDEFDLSLDALRHFTVFGSAEFAIRAFIGRQPARTLAVMATWSRDPDEHIRRLASEGCRPRLPWGQRLAGLVRDPGPIASILDQLKDDPSLYVRKSVANNLNDIAKDHPDWVLQKLETWALDSPRTAWIARRAARTLIKRGHPRALRLFGIGDKPRAAAALTAAPRTIRLGEVLTLTATLRSGSRKPQRLAIDYVVHYVKSRGHSSEKVFKWTEIELLASAGVTLTKRQTIRDFSIRRHHPGRHRVELQVNGQRVAETVFVLKRGDEIAKETPA